jgi:hypothetical protein
MKATTMSVSTHLKVIRAGSSALMIVSTMSPPNTTTGIRIEKTV